MRWWGQLTLWILGTGFFAAALDIIIEKLTKKDFVAQAIAIAWLTALLASSLIY
jgi:hypothetical protein